MRRERLTAGSAFGSQRTLWSELSEVQAAGLLTNLDNKSRKLQEAYFEVITSEASYLRSLNVLISNFLDAPELSGPKKALSIITSSDRKHLFSNILSIRDCSENLLRDLESRLKESLVLTDVCDILSEHFDKHFTPYVLYCSNQIYQDRTLKRLK
jgi:neuronal guanine nucleotide exchange factor